MYLSDCLLAGSGTDWLTVNLSSRCTAEGNRILYQGPLSTLEAEYTAVQRVLMVVPAELHLQIVCCSLQGIMDMSLNLDRWNWGGWVYQDGSSIPGVSVLQRVFELLNCREHQVQWKVVHSGQPHKRYAELVEILRIGVRLAQPPPPPTLLPEQQCGQHLFVAQWV